MKSLERERENREAEKIIIGIRTVIDVLSRHFSRVDIYFSQLFNNVILYMRCRNVPKYCNVKPVNHRNRRLFRKIIEKRMNYAL